MKREEVIGEVQIASNLSILYNEVTIERLVGLRI